MRCQFVDPRGKKCRSYGDKNEVYCVVHKGLTQGLQREFEARMQEEIEEPVGAEEAQFDPFDPGPEDVIPSLEDYPTAPPTTMGAALGTAEIDEPPPASPLAGFKREAKAEPEHRRVRPAARTRERVVPEPEDESPEVAADRRVQALLTLERQEKIDQGSGERDKEGITKPDAVDRTRATYRVIARIPIMDETEIIDPVTGERPACIPHGWLVRWVRTRDHRDRPNRALVAKRERCGWLVITDANGEPIEGMYGLAMMGSPEAQAAFTLLGTASGLQHRDEALELASQIAADAREQVGDDAVSVVIGNDHRREREMVSTRRREIEVTTAR